MALKDLSTVEQKIMKGFLDRIDALRVEHSKTRVSIYDGEEWSLKGVAGVYDRKAVESVIGITDETIIRVWVGEERSDVHFYHGNEEDLVSDISHTNNGAWIGDRLTAGL